MSPGVSNRWHDCRLTCPSPNRTFAQASVGLSRKLVQISGGSSSPILGIILISQFGHQSSSYPLDNSLRLGAVRQHLGAVVRPRWVHGTVVLITPTPAASQYIDTVDAAIDVWSTGS